MVKYHSACAETHVCTFKTTYRNIIKKKQTYIFMSKLQFQIETPILNASLVNVALAGSLFIEPNVSGSVVFIKFEPYKKR